MTSKLIPTKIGREIIRHGMLKGLKSLSPSTIKNKLLTELHDSYKLHNPVRSNPKKFQHPHASSIIIYNDSTEVYRKKGLIPKKVLNKICSKYPKAIVMVDLGNELYKAISIKTYKKLVKIKFIVLDREFEFLINEFNIFEDWIESQPISSYIYSVNQLLHVISIEEAFDVVNKHYLDCKLYDLVSVVKTCKILYKNGKVETIDFEEFLNTYRLEITKSLQYD